MPGVVTVTSVQELSAEGDGGGDGGGDGDGDGASDGHKACLDMVLAIAQI